MELIDTQPIMPGVMDYLKSARERGLKVGLASSSSCSWVTFHLERLELMEYFDAIAAGDDVPRTKPDPALYWTALSWMRVRAEHAIAIEDSYNGMLAAKRAGLRCVVVPHALTRHMNFDLADLRLDSLADLSLEDLLSRFNGCLGS
jgi:HAD superfamily hydrolase (TIGR01509 family)